ncbi:MAG: flagellar basal body rod protein FlgB [Negativicutes bacterium]|nr:flagellar basal body rod protein FlgB [Negativicutes bacterium]
MVKSILSSPQEMILENALSGSATRHKLISNNIANVNTPGFKRSDVAFEDVLASAVGNGQSQLSQTNSRHLPGRQNTGFSPAITTDSSTSVRTDGNNVDIDIEMSNLAKNDIYYQSVAQTLNRYFSDLLTAIKGQ